ncbi:unnamed protein product [Vitrella brassicaformis CCMP3155]|uniref:FAD-binding PCMH-type domain-containing protein n=2 Tax=Vitrella brassicaformis TaxID=1169539 RepID=A0A0G4GAN1_VITBC|nr:unnamed protein product [Vitrella brassicaformis CCMP3155]|eukprot:CEM25789.1 unnamed protein product [Vitrella brassicaformis CCMP3155]
MADGTGEMSPLVYQLDGQTARIPSAGIDPNASLLDVLQHTGRTEFECFAALVSFPDRLHGGWTTPPTPTYTRLVSAVAVQGATITTLQHLPAELQTMAEKWGGVGAAVAVGAAGVLVSGGASSAEGLMDSEAMRDWVASVPCDRDDATDLCKALSFLATLDTSFLAKDIADKTKAPLSLIETLLRPTPTPIPPSSSLQHLPAFVHLPTSMQQLQATLSATPAPSFELLYGSSTFDHTSLTESQARIAVGDLPAMRGIDSQTTHVTFGASVVLQQVMDTIERHDRADMKASHFDALADHLRVVAPRGLRNVLTVGGAVLRELSGSSRGGAAADLLPALVTWQASVQFYTTADLSSSGEQQHPQPQPTSLPIEAFLDRIGYPNNKTIKWSDYLLVSVTLPLPEPIDAAQSLYRAYRTASPVRTGRPVGSVCCWAALDAVTRQLREVRVCASWEGGMGRLGRVEEFLQGYGLTEETAWEALKIANAQMSGQVPSGTQALLFKFLVLLGGEVSRGSYDDTHLAAPSPRFITAVLPSLSLTPTPPLPSISIMAQQQGHQWQQISLTGAKLGGSVAMAAGCAEGAAVERLKASIGWGDRCAAVDKHNGDNRWRKRGVAVKSAQMAGRDVAAAAEVEVDALTGEPVIQRLDIFAVIPSQKGADAESLHRCPYVAEALLKGFLSSCGGAVALDPAHTEQAFLTSTASLPQEVTVYMSQQQREGDSASVGEGDWLPVPRQLGAVLDEALSHACGSSAAEKEIAQPTQAVEWSLPAILKACETSIPDDLRLRSVSRQWGESGRDVESGRRIPERVQVAIAGGGLGGLLLCAALRKRGIDAHVFERAPALRNASQGIFMADANGIKAIRMAYRDIADEFEQTGVFCPSSQLVVRKDELPETRTALKRDQYVDKFGAPCVMMRWTAAQNTFASHVPSDVVHCGHGARGWTETEEDVCMLFEGRPDDYHVKASLVVAADGSFSALRPHIVAQSRSQQQQQQTAASTPEEMAAAGGKGGGLNPFAASVLVQDPPHYYKNISYNAMIPTESVGERVHGDHEVVKVDSNTPFLSAFLVDAGSGLTFWLLRLPAPDASRPGRSAIGRQGVRQRLLNYVKTGRLDGTGGADYSSKHSDIMAAISATPEEQIFERHMFSRDAIDKWSSPRGRVVLLGDSAHAPHPLAGQGANQVFEDVAVLVDEIGKLREKHGGDGTWLHRLPDAVAAYEKVRVPRASVVQQFSTMVGDAEREGRRVSGKKLSELLVSFKGWINKFPDTEGQPSLNDLAEDDGGDEAAKQ